MFEVTSFVSSFPYLGIVLLLLLGNAGFPFPEDTTLLLCGALIAHDVIRPLPTFLVIYPSLLLTDFSLYWVGKKYGTKVVEQKRFRRIVSPERLSRIEEKFKKWGILVVFFGRHLWGLRAQVFLAAGVMKMPAAKFLLADAASSLFTMALMVGIGYFGGSRIHFLKKWVTEIEYMIVILLALLFGGWFGFRHLKKKRG